MSKTFPLPLNGKNLRICVAREEWRRKSGICVSVFHMAFAAYRNRVFATRFCKTRNKSRAAGRLRFGTEPPVLVYVTITLFARRRLYCAPTMSRFTGTCSEALKVVECVLFDVEEARSSRGIRKEAKRRSDNEGEGTGKWRENARTKKRGKRKYLIARHPVNYS